MLRFLICDDDSRSLHSLEAALYARYGTDRAHVAAFSEPYETLDYIESGKAFDAAILDIIMPEMKGTTLAAAMRARGFRGAVIFLTTSRGYAPESYEVDALDYILKPVDSGRLNAALDKLEAWLRKEDNANIVLTTERETRRVPLRDISCAEAGDHVTGFTLESGESFTARGNFREFAPMLLDDPRFAQCHGSFVVNMDKVKSLSEGNALLSDGKHIPIARRYSAFRKQYMDWLMKEGGV